MNGSFCFFLQKEALFFFEKKSQKTLSSTNGRRALAEVGAFPRAQFASAR
jgi:hypothetical protein